MPKFNREEERYLIRGLQAVTSLLERPLESREKNDQFFIKGERDSSTLDPTNIVSWSRITFIE